VQNAVSNFGVLEKAEMAENKEKRKNEKKYEAAQLPGSKGGAPWSAALGRRLVADREARTKSPIVFLRVCCHFHCQGAMAVDLLN
jgi:hypothetical protein